MTDIKVNCKILLIASLLMAIAGLLFIGLSIFAPEPDRWDLAMGLSCVVLANLFNIIRMQMLKKD